jgi:transposase
VQEVIPVKRKNPYSLIDVNTISIEALTRDRPGQKAAAGVDVAKGELVVCVVWPDRSFERPWRVKSPQETGLVVAMLLELDKCCPVTVAMESSGTYGDSLRQALDDAGLPVDRVSAKAVKDDSEGEHKCRRMNAECRMQNAERGRRRATKNCLGKTFSHHRVFQSQPMIRCFCGPDSSFCILHFCQRHWPEAGRLTNQSGPTLTKVLEHYGDPRQLAKDPEAVDRLAKFGGHWLGDEKIERLIDSGRSTVGVRMNAWAAREMKDIASSIIAQRRTIQQCRRELRKLTKDHKAIQSQAAAVGLVTACVLWMCLGDPRQYGSAGAYRKAMGLNLTERSSGQYKGRLKLSKRGQRLPRKWLYFAALRWMREPSVRTWLENKKQRDGGRGGKAATGVMRRLAAAAWHAGQGEVFDAKRLFPGARRAVADCK